MIRFRFEGTGIVTGWEALKDGTSIGLVCILWRRWRRTAQKMISPPIIMTAIPPITPPTTAPTDTPDDAEEGVVVDVGRAPVTSGWASSSNVIHDQSSLTKLEVANLLLLYLLLA